MVLVVVLLAYRWRRLGPNLFLSASLAGAIMNTTCLAANGLRMPVDPALLASTHSLLNATHSAAIAGTRLPWLMDRFFFSEVRWAGIFSIGDLLLWTGIICMVLRFGLGRAWPKKGAPTDISPDPKME
jgi:uncharacterized membrane protein